MSFGVNNDFEPQYESKYGAKNMQKRYAQKTESDSAKFSQKKTVHKKSSLGTVVKGLASAATLFVAVKYRKNIGPFIKRLSPKAENSITKNLWDKIKNLKPKGENPIGKTKINKDTIMGTFRSIKNALFKKS